MQRLSGLDNKGESDMASSKEYLRFILDRLSEVEGVSHRAMMGEYLLYLHGKVVGGIYDNRLLVKPCAAAIRYMPEKVYEKPYEGAKDMLLVECVDDSAWMAGLFRAIGGSASCASAPTGGQKG